MYHTLINLTDTIEEMKQMEGRGCNSLLEEKAIHAIKLIIQLEKETGLDKEFADMGYKPTQKMYVEGVTLTACSEHVQSAKNLISQQDTIAIAFAHWYLLKIHSLLYAIMLYCGGVDTAVDLTDDKYITAYIM